MARPSLAILAPAAAPNTAKPGSESPLWAASSEQVLMATLAAMCCFGLLRVAILLREGCRSSWPASTHADKTIVMSPFLFVAAVANISIKVATTMSHGLLAVKWVLAGDEAGFPLVTCFMLVAVNTELLVGAALVSHMRSILVRVAASRGYRIDFLGITNLLRTPLGQVSIIWTATATLVLLANTYEHAANLWRLAPWLATAAGSLVWANSALTGIGATSWEDLESLATESTPVVTLPQFLAHISEGKLEDHMEEQALGMVWRLVSWLSKPWSLSSEDVLLQKSWPKVLRCAFPNHANMRGLHTAVVGCFRLLPFAVPSLLVAYSLSRVPQLAAFEVVGGRITSEFTSAISEYVVLLEESWDAELTFKFEMEVGQASRVDFCCQGHCSDMKPKDRKHSE
ncbi:unnamed protein product, partial [Symbiodinium sp. CCMP2456]